MSDCNLIIGLSCSYYTDSEKTAEERYLKIYKPFLRKLYEYPEIKAVLHISGELLEWFDEKHPEVIMLIDELVRKRKQVEVLGGGYYEPIFPMLSPQDRSGQLEALTTFLRKKFSKRPRGCWIGHIWDNTLITPITNSGMDYLFLETSSINVKENFTPFITEDAGKLIRIFPVNSALISEKITLDTENVENFLSFFKEEITSPEKIISLFFTDKIVEMLPDQWIDKFFAAISADRSIKIINPATYLKNNPKLKKIYIQNSSYYKDIFADNYDINLLYARMIYVQTLVNQMKGDKYKKRSAMESLWAGQNHAAYIGKTYNSFSVSEKKRYRITTYKNLIEAEVSTRQKGVFIPSLFKNDFDMDGLDEYLYQGESYNASIHQEGGSVFEIDYLKERWNYNDTINYANGSSYSTLKKSFTDYFADFSQEGFAGVDDFIKKDITELAAKEYTVSEFDREQKTVSFSVKVKTEEKGLLFKILKKYVFDKNKIELFYTISNIGSVVINHNFGCAIYLSLPDASFTSQLTPRSYNKNDKEFLIDDSKTVITVSADRDGDFLWEEKKENDSYLYTAVLPIYHIVLLEPGKSWENRITLKFG